MSNLFQKLRENNSSPGASPSSAYSFGQGAANHPFRERPGTTTTSGATMVTPNRGAKPPPQRSAEGDRPHAYAPPVKQDPGVVYEWEPPSFVEILKDLGLRILEVSIAAAAYAAGEEVAYFFRRRRFYTDEQRQRRDF